MWSSPPPCLKRAKIATVITSSSGVLFIAPESCLCDHPPIPFRPTRPSPLADRAPRSPKPPGLPAAGASMLRVDAREPPRRPHPGAVGGPERAPARGGHPRRGPAADPRRRGQRQDARARPPDRVPALLRPGTGGRDPGDHVHEQGRQGDARPRRAAAWARHARDVADDLPCRLRTDPARRGRAPGIHAPVHDLRPGRRAPADQALHRRAVDRSQALHAGRPAQSDLGGQEQADRR